MTITVIDIAYKVRCRTIDSILEAQFIGGSNVLHNRRIYAESLENKSLQEGIKKL